VHRYGATKLIPGRQLWSVARHVRAASFVEMRFFVMASTPPQRFADCLDKSECQVLLSSAKDLLVGASRHSYRIDCFGPPFVRGGFTVQDCVCKPCGY